MISILAIAAVSALWKTPERRAVDGCPAGAVLFARGSAELDTNALNWLSFQVSSTLQRMLRDGGGGSWIEIDGSIDDGEAVPAGAELDRQRAEAVRDYLIRIGVPADLVRAAGGSASEARPNQSIDNRRAEQRSVWISIQMDEKSWRRMFPAGAPTC